MSHTTPLEGADLSARRAGLDQRLVAYAVKVSRFVEQLPDTTTGHYAGGQLLRSGMATLPVCSLSRTAGSQGESLDDLRVCLKNLEEGRRWLRFVRQVPLIDPPEAADSLLLETESLVRIIVARLWTARCRSAPWRLRLTRPAYSVPSSAWLMRSARRRNWRARR